MKCEEYQAIIEEYLDGELDYRAAARVRSHLSACAACTDLVEQMRREQEIYARYRRDVEVTPSLWAGVQARIEKERVAPVIRPAGRLREWFTSVFGSPRLSPAFAAALVLVTIGVTVAVMSYLNSRGTDQKQGDAGSVAGVTKEGEGPQVGPEVGAGGAPQKGETAPVNAGPAPERKRVQVAVHKATPQANPDQLVREAEQKYLAAIAILSRDVKGKQMEPAMLARFTIALNDIDRTIAETRRAARQNPDDPVALQYMLAAYSKKVEVLREMAKD